MLGAYCIATTDHPSLNSELERFLDELAAEQRYFGPSARCAPKPSRALLTGLRAGGGFRLVAVDRQRVIGAIRVDDRGELFVAVLASHRGGGLGRSLTEAAVAQARRRGHRSIVLRTTRRATAALRLGTRLGGTALVAEHGGLEVVIDLAASAARADVMPGTA